MPLTNSCNFFLLLLFTLEHEVANGDGVRCYHCNTKCEIPVKEMFTYECIGMCHQMFDPSGAIIYRACGRHSYLGCRPYAITHTLCTCAGNLCNGAPLLGQVISPKNEIVSRFEHKNKCYKCGNQLECQAFLQTMEIVPCNYHCDQKFSKHRIAVYRGCATYNQIGCKKVDHEDYLEVCGCKGDLCNGRPHVIPETTKKQRISGKSSTIKHVIPELKKLYITVNKQVQCYKCNYGNCDVPEKNMEIVNCTQNCFRGITEDMKVNVRGCGLDKDEGCKPVSHDEYLEVCGCKGDLCNGGAQVIKEQYVVPTTPSSIGTVRCYQCNYGRCDVPEKNLEIVNCTYNCFRGVTDDLEVNVRGCGVDKDEGCKPVSHDAYSKVCGCKGDLCNGGAQVIPEQSLVPTPSNSIGSSTSIESPLYIPKITKCYTCRDAECNSRPLKGMKIEECHEHCEQRVHNNGTALSRQCSNLSKKDRCEKYDEYSRICGCTADLCNGIPPNRIIFVPPGKQVVVTGNNGGMETTKCYNCLEGSCDMALTDLKVVECAENCEQKLNDDGEVIFRGCACNKTEGCNKVVNNKYSQVCSCKGDLCNGEPLD